MLTRDETVAPVPAAAHLAVSRLRTGLLLAGLILATFLLKCIRLVEDPVWIDEAASIGIGSLPWSVLFGEMARVEASPPGYYAIAKVVGLVAGQEGAPLRLLSAAAAALSILPLWIFCREAFGARAAWLAALIIALHGLLFRLSQDGRTYAVLFFVFTCALLAAWRLAQAARRGEAGVLPVLALGLCQGAMLWLHHTAGIANLALNVFVLVYLLAARGAVLRGLVLLALADLVGLLVGGAPILWALHHATEGAFVTRWIAPPDLMDIAMIYARGLVAPFQSPVSGITALLSAGAVLFGLVTLRRPGWATRAALAGLLGTAGILFPVVSQAWPVMLERTVLFMAAPLAASIAAGLALLPRRAFFGTAALMVGLHAYGIAAYLNWPDHKERWDEAAVLLQASAGPDDRIVVTDSVFAAMSLRMAAAERGGLTAPLIVVPATSPLEQLSARLLDPAGDVQVAELCQRLHGAGSVWLVARPVPDIVEDDPGFSTWGPVIRVFRAAGGEKIADGSLPTVQIERWRVPGC